MLCLSKLIIRFYFKFCFNMQWKFIPNLNLFLGEFELSIDAGQFTDSEIIVMLGENGTGKTTFIKMLAGRLVPDGGGNACFQYYLRTY